MKLSIVATLYQSASYIDEFYRRTTASARQFSEDDYEIIFVNDGSPDNSLDIAVQLSENDHHVIVIDLSRNFGHHKAMRAGLEHARGEKIFLIDVDLEEEPEWLIDFSQHMTHENADVVYGVQKERKGDWFERWSGALYYTLLNALLSIEHPRNITTARLMSKRYVSALLSHREVEAVISCLWVITGFKQCARPVTKHMKPTTTYNLSRKINHLVNAITSFSVVPLKFIFFCGLLVFFSAVVYICYLVFIHFTNEQSLDGWTSIMASIWLLGGLIISFIGVIGIYIAKIFSETKQRPYAIIRNIYGQSKQ